MSFTYIIDNTAGTLSFTIDQGEKDGPGGTQWNTDLTLHGYGVLRWGEAVNENLVRLTENFAVPRKELGDYNPSSGLQDYDPATDPILPKDEIDLGSPGLGINKPIIGQTWYNTEDDQRALFINTVEGWKNVGGLTNYGASLPATGIIGEQFYDTTTTTLYVHNGVSWVSGSDDAVQKSGDTMSGFLTLSADPVNNLHAATKQYVDNGIIAGITGKVDLAGDTMDASADLTFNGGEVLGLPATPSVGGAAASKTYVDNEITSAPFVLRAGDTMTGSLKVNADLTASNSSFYMFNNSTARTPFIALAQLDTTSPPPHFDLYNADNDPNAGGAAGVYGYTRLINRDGDVLRIEADEDHVETGTGPNTKAFTRIRQDGTFQHSGVAGSAPGVFYAPNCSSTEIDSFGDNRALITKEYMTSYVDFVNLFQGPQYLPASTFYNGNNTNWITIDANSHGVPQGASRVIIDIESRSTSEGIEGGVQIKQNGLADTYAKTSAWWNSAGNGHSGSGGQATCRIDSNGQFRFRVGRITNGVFTNAGGVTGFLRVIGFYY